MGHNALIAASRYIGSGSFSDTTAPTIGTLAVPTNVCQTTLTLSWTAATDNIAVTGYEIWRNGVFYLDVENVLTYNLTGLTTGASYNWQVLAYDAASNKSSLSNVRSQTQGVTVYEITLGIGEESSGAFACVQTIDQTFYKTVNSNITLGHIIYLDACGSEVLVGGDQYWSNGTVSFQVSNSGAISNIQACS